MKGRPPDSSKTRRKKELRREHAAMLSHFELMHGLAVISNARIRRFIEAVQDQRDKGTSDEDMLDVVRKAVCHSESIELKARMLWDANREVDLFVWGPMQLFFCLATAFLRRYGYLKTRYPDVVLEDLERYIEDNRAGLEAAETLRNWVLHPGHNRRPDDAMEELFAAGGPPGNAYPQEMVNRLLDLAARYSEVLGDEVG